jgi:hypothetical protein
MKPGRRRGLGGADIKKKLRKNTKLLQRVDDGHVSIERQQSDMLSWPARTKVLLCIHLMWNWVDKSGYFGTCAEEELIVDLMVSDRMSVSNTGIMHPSWVFQKAAAGC